LGKLAYVGASCRTFDWAHVEGLYRHLWKEWDPETSSGWLGLDKAKLTQAILVLKPGKLFQGEVKFYSDSNNPDVNQVIIHNSSFITFQYPNSFPFWIAGKPNCIHDGMGASFR